MENSERVSVRGLAKAIPWALVAFAAIAALTWIGQFAGIAMVGGLGALGVLVQLLREPALVPILLLLLLAAVTHANGLLAAVLARTSRGDEDAGDGS